MAHSFSSFLFPHLSNCTIPGHPYEQLPNSQSRFLNSGQPYVVKFNCDEFTYNWSDCFPLTFPKATLFQFIVNGMGISIVAILGIFGNILSAMVLSRPQMKSSVTCLLIGLAFCDTLLISISIFVFSLPFLYVYIDTEFLSNYVNTYFGLLAPYLYPISTTALTGSVYLKLAVSIDRYVTVCHSLKARSICTWGKAKICVAVVCCLSILYNLPRWWEVIAISGCESVNNTTLYVSGMSWLRDDPTYGTVYIKWSYLLIMYLIPFVGQVAFNIALYEHRKCTVELYYTDLHFQTNAILYTLKLKMPLSVRKANREREIFSTNQRREISVSDTLSVVVAVSLLCNLLPLVSHISESFYDTSFDHLTTISNFLLVLNSSGNFVIYVTCGERFRHTLTLLVKNCMDCRFG